MFLKVRYLSKQNIEKSSVSMPKQNHPLFRTAAYVTSLRHDELQNMSTTYLQVDLDSGTNSKGKGSWTMNLIRTELDVDSELEANTKVI